MPKFCYKNIKHVKNGGNKMHLNNQHLQAIKTTKNYYKNKIKEEKDDEKKLIYEAMIEDLTEEEKRILAEDNILLDELEKGK